MMVKILELEYIILKPIIKVNEINKTIENLYSNSIDIEEVKQIYTDIDKSLISIEKHKKTDFRCDMKFEEK